MVRPSGLSRISLASLLVAFDEPSAKSVQVKSVFVGLDEDAVRLEWIGMCSREVLRGVNGPESGACERFVSLYGARPSGRSRLFLPSTLVNTQHSFFSTFGGNPLASAVAIASLEVIRDEGLAERSAQKGEQLRHQLKKVHQQFPEIIKEVRGKGLFTAVELNRRALFPVTAYDICLRLKERGILAKPTHDSIIRLTPPLSISSEELLEGIQALHDVFELDLPKMQKEKPEAVPPTTSDNKDNQSLKIDTYIIHSCQEGWEMRELESKPQEFSCDVENEKPVDDLVI
ncbi:hypothetical protein RJ639_028659 [Escallonia herrerae]|uniref:Ornithine aminotransferase n=1 Tax=Escallonia herrerae TaxID=1293975 RepID=A0AA88XM13_9ASTE|nr:hypothetical protein RJ639_028659 [Escallonia herrerae]